MLEMRSRDWVQGILVPWIIFFTLAAVASAFSLGSKLLFFVRKVRSRFRRSNHGAMGSATDPTIEELLDENEFHKRKIYT